MEVVAAIASVAGILSLLGQCVGNTEQLRDFIADVSSASASIDRFLGDINSQLQTLHAVGSLLENLPADFNRDLIQSLATQLGRYTNDVCRWLEKAKAIRPPSNIGSKTWLKSFWIALNVKSVGDVREQMDRHKQAISLTLSLFGRYSALADSHSASILIPYMDISTARDILSLDGKVTQGTAASLSKIEEQNGVLEVIEYYSLAGMQSSAASEKSLQSISTSLSRLQGFASSAASASGSQGINHGGLARKRVRPTRRNNGDFYRRRRRSSAGSTVSRGHSSASAKSLPAVPVIPKELLVRTFNAAHGPETSPNESIDPHQPVKIEFG